MHEFAVTQGILDVAIKGANDQGARKINKIRLNVGAMSDIVGDCVDFYFQELSKGTIAEGAVLEIDLIAARAICRNCHTEFTPEEFMLQCPKCGQFGAEMIAGDELQVASIDIDTQD